MEMCRRYLSRAPFNMSPKGAICMHDIDSIHIILKESQNVSKRLKRSKHIAYSRALIL